MQRIFGGKVTDEMESDDGLVIARIEVEPESRYENTVTAYVVERSSGETVYKLVYKTINPRLQAYYVASDDIRRYCHDQDYIIDGDIMTNVSLPFIGNVDGKSAR